MKNGNEKPVYEISTNQTKVIFKSQVEEITTVEIDERIINELNERQKKAVEYLKEHGKITRSEYVDIWDSKISPRTALNDLQQMVNMKIIILKGKKKSAHYIIKA